VLHDDEGEMSRTGWVAEDMCAVWTPRPRLTEALPTEADRYPRGTGLALGRCRLAGHLGCYDEHGNGSRHGISAAMRRPAAAGRPL